MMSKKQKQVDQAEQSNKQSRLVLFYDPKQEDNLLNISSSTQSQENSSQQSEEQIKQQDGSMQELNSLKAKIGNIKLIVTDKLDTDKVKINKIYEYLRCTNESDLPNISRIRSKNQQQAQKKCERDNKIQNLQDIYPIQILCQSIYQSKGQKQENLRIKELKQQLQIRIKEMENNHIKQIAQLENKIKLLQIQIAEKDYIAKDHQLQLQKVRIQLKQRLCILISKETELQNMERNLIQALNQNRELNIQNRKLKQALQAIQQQMVLQLQSQKDLKYEQLRRRSFESNLMKQAFANDLELANKRMNDYKEAIQKEKEQYENRLRDRQNYINSLEEQRNQNKMTIQKLVENCNALRYQKKDEVSSLIKINQQLKQRIDQLKRDSQKGKLIMQKNKNSQLETLKQQVSFLKQQIQKTNKLMQMQKKKLQVQTIRFEAELTQLKSIQKINLSKLKDQKKMLENKIASLEQQLSLRNRRNDQLLNLQKQQIAKNLLILADYSSKIKTLEQENRRLINNVNQFTKKYQSQNKKVKQLQDTQTQLRASLQKLQEEINQHKLEKIQKTQENTQKLQHLQQQYQNELQIYKIQNQNVKEELRVVQIQKQKFLMNQIQKPDQEIYQLIKKKLNLQQRIILILRQLNSISSKITPVQKENLIKRIGFILPTSK